MSQARRQKMQSLASVLVLAAFLSPSLGAFSNQQATAAEEQSERKYLPTSESLRSHPLPRWFDEAKFGIFIHWGPYAVPAYHEWYIVFISPRANYGFLFGGPPFSPSPGNLPKQLVDKLTREAAVAYHLKHWGADFDYDRFIPLFKAEKFDPEAWADLFYRAGARYVVFTAKHGDEFAMWPTRYTNRNAMAMGPKRDLAGELLKAVRARGLKMGFYHNTTYTFYDERYPGRDWVRYMNNTIKELVDLYQPDILWGDVLVGPIKDGNGNPLPADYWGAKEVLAYFYNHSPQPDEVVANDRWGPDVDGSYLGDFRTYERRLPRGVLKEKWEHCESLDPYSWGYRKLTPDYEYLTPNQVVDLLVDVVSKNGNLLLNIGPRADGTIPEIMETTLLEVGNWLRVNGEAIYGTKPWKIFKDGEFRFTARGDLVYAIALEWPSGDILLRSLAGESVRSISLLGSKQQLSWQMTPEGLLVKLPATPEGKYAYALRIELGR